MNATILIVDDEPAQRQWLHYMTEEKLGYRTQVLGSGQEAINYILSGREPRPDAVLLDLMMPGTSGMEVIHAVRPVRQILPVIVMAAQSDIEKAVQAVKAGASDFLIKPAGAERLGISLENTMRLSMLSREVLHLQRQDRPGISSRMQVRPSAPGMLPLIDNTGNLRSMAELEASIIEFALSYYDGHMSKIARDLAIGRSTLYRKLHDLNLQHPRSAASASA